MKEGLKKEGGKDPGPAVLQNPLLVSCWPELGHRTTPGCKEGWEAVCPAKNQEIFYVEERRTDSRRLRESCKHLPSCLRSMSAHRPNLASSSQPRLLSQQKASLQGWKLHTVNVGSGRGKINLNQTQERCWRAVNFIVYEKIIRTLKAI